MTPFATRLRAMVLFYRSVAPFMVGVSALIIGFVLLPALHEGWARGLWPALVLTKLATGPAVRYLSEQMRPDQYWFYYNLGVSRRFLWGSVGALDGLLFLGCVLGLSANQA